MAEQVLDVVLAEEAFVVVNKPGGMLAVPGRGVDKQDCVVSRVRRMWPECIPQPAVHRLDMATSGLMVLGLTRAAHRHLSQQFERRTVIKRYEAIINGTVVGSGGQIELAFRLDPDNRPYQVYDPVGGKTGRTRWRVIKRYRETTRVEFFPQTGRTHQLRLHASHQKGLGFPIVGDALYGDGEEGGRMLLHASGIQFVHPVSGHALCCISPVPF